MCVCVFFFFFFSLLFFAGFGSLFARCLYQLKSRFQAGLVARCLRVLQCQLHGRFQTSKMPPKVRFGSILSRELFLFSFLVLFFLLFLLFSSCFSFFTFFHDFLLVHLFFPLLFPFFSRSFSPFYFFRFFLETKDRNGHAKKYGGGGAHGPNREKHVE